MAWLPILELVLGVGAFGLAGLVLRADLRGAANRRLALLLMVDGVGWFGVASAGLLVYPPAAEGLLVVVRLTLAASPWLYTAFVAHALQHAPLVRPLRSARAQATLYSLAVAVPLFLLFFGEAAFYQPVRQHVGLITGPHLVLATYALVAGIQELRRSPQRRRAVSYLAAFAVRDLALLVLFSAALVQKRFPTMELVEAILAFVKVLLLFHVMLLTYGLLSGQVLGMDDKVRLGMQKTFVMAMVAAIFITMTEGIEEWLDVDSTALAIAAAGAVTFLFRPIYSLGARISARILPATSLEGTYGERLQVYAQQAAVAWRDGRLTEKERDMLDRLALNLGLPGSACHVAEEQARKAAGAAVGGSREEE